MSHSFEEAIIRHCAATLAGHKCGSLFCCASCTQEDIESANAVLNAKGVAVMLLKSCRHGNLVYVYRPHALRECIERADAAEFLRTCGYVGSNVSESLGHLKCRMQAENFPHEIGVFLGYPLEDVVAFIENKGENCPLTGCWKAYTDAAGAQKTFALYRKCRDVYMRCFARGFDVARLTVAV